MAPWASRPYPLASASAFLFFTAAAASAAAMRRPSVALLPALLAAGPHENLCYLYTRTPRGRHIGKGHNWSHCFPPCGKECKFRSDGGKSRR